MKSESVVKPRPVTKLYGQTLELPLKEVQQLMRYCTQRKWYELWKPKRAEHLYALCKGKVYEIHPDVRSNNSNR